MRCILSHRFGRMQWQSSNQCHFHLHRTPCMSDYFNIIPRYGPPVTSATWPLTPKRVGMRRSKSLVAIRYGRFAAIFSRLTGLRHRETYRGVAILSALGPEQRLVRGYENPFIRSNKHSHGATDMTWRIQAPMILSTVHLILFTGYFAIVSLIHRGAPIHLDQGTNALLEYPLSHPDFSLFNITLTTLTSLSKTVGGQCVNT